MTALLQVVQVGLHASVQDAGRPGWGHLGVSTSGACDRSSLRIANDLLGNPVDAPALEIALGGLEVRLLRTTVLGLAGADLGAEVVDEGRRLRPNLAHLVREGSTVRFAGAADASEGYRAYLALPGGIAVPHVLGSASMDPSLGAPGLVGRPVAAGDTIAASAADRLEVAGNRYRGPTVVPFSQPVPLRVVLGPHAGSFPRGSVEAMLDTTWTVSADSDRRGCRLQGSEVAGAPAGLVSLPVSSGAIQVPPDGRPILLLADHQTVGGYPVIAVVIAADRALAGQIPPGASLRLRPVSLEEARRAAAEAREGRHPRSALVP